MLRYRHIQELGSRDSESRRTEKLGIVQEPEQEAKGRTERERNGRDYTGRGCRRPWRRRGKERRSLHTGGSPPKDQPRETPGAAQTEEGKEIDNGVQRGSDHIRTS